MKKLLYLTIVAITISFCVPSLSWAQGVGINSSNNPPDPSAALDINLPNKGTLISRMNTSQRNAISNPAAGLLIYNTDCNSFNYYNGSAWVDMAGNTVSGPPAAPVAATHTITQTQIVWNWNAVAGATGYKWTTSNNYSNAMDNGTGTSYTQNSLTCNTAYTLYVWAYNGCSKSNVAVFTQTTSACCVGFTTCGNSFCVNHTIGAVAPETKAVTYGTVLTSLSGSGKCWITQNLGADNQATSATDATNASAGWYWQFNRKQGYKVGPTPPWTITAISEASDWVSANDPCSIELGAGWRIPTTTEWTNADANGQVGGWDNYNETYADVLKLHAAGYLATSNGILSGRGTDAIYWSSTQRTNGTNGWDIYINGSESRVTDGAKSFGLSIRCIKD